jgi:HAD superfamily hydrolase (TIGR01509 family)
MKQTFKAKGIVLDLDGTIVDSTEAYVQAAKIAFSIFDKTAPSRELLLEIPRRMEQGLPFDDVIGMDPKCFVPHYLKAYYSVVEKNTRLIPNVKKTLETLSDKAKLALITMRHAPNGLVCKELDYLGVSKYFSYIVTALDTVKPKPHPEGLVHCSEALNVEMSDWIIAGDSVNDVRMGKSVGIPTIAVLSGLYHRDELARECPDLILNDINALPQFIE